MDLGLKGKRALVTGASRGIGRAIAEQFAAEGAGVAICARNAAGLNAAAESLRTHGGPVFAAAANVSDGEAVKRWIDDAASALGGVDIFVSNASGLAPGASGDQQWRSLFEVDLLGAVRGVETCLPYLERSDAGSIIFISTTAALETFFSPPPYGAIKAALITYANALSQSLGAKGIRCNVVSPGPIFFEGGSWDQIRQHMPALYETTLKGSPLGRLGTPEEVARAVVFLASPAASLLTGVNLVADGGYTKRVNF